MSIAARVLLAALACVPGVAAAQSFDVFDTWLVEAKDGTPTENGAGAPALVYNPRSDEFELYFESRLSEDHPFCPGGRWIIGRARSKDGRHFEVDPEPILAPLDGTFYSCGAAHPAAVVVDGRTHLWFKALQRDDTCERHGTPRWGCDRQTGVGHAVVHRRQVIPDKIPVLPITDMGFPSVVQVDGTWHMLLAKVPAIHHATAPHPSGPWTLDSLPVLEPGFNHWSPDRLFNPSLSCKTDDPYNPFELFVGGKELDGGSVAYGGWGRAVSHDATDWLVAFDPIYSWTGDFEWRHWDVRLVDNPAAGRSDYIVYFSEKDERGRNRIGHAYSSGDIDPRDIVPRVCRR